MKWRRVIAASPICAAAVVIVVWLMRARQVGGWLEVHTGTVGLGNFGSTLCAVAMAFSKPPGASPC